MQAASLKLAIACIILPLSCAAMAATNSGMINFVGSIVEPPCSTSMTQGFQPATIQVNIHCEKLSALDVGFRRVGHDINSPATIIVTRDGKQIGNEETSQYRMALEGQTSLGLSTNRAAPGSALGPIIMTISYL